MLSKDVPVGLWCLGVSPPLLARPRYALALDRQGSLKSFPMLLKLATFEAGVGSARNFVKRTAPSLPPEMC